MWCLQVPQWWGTGPPFPTLLLTLTSPLITTMQLTLRVLITASAASLNHSWLFPLPQFPIPFSFFCLLLLLKFSVKAGLCLDYQTIRIYILSSGKSNNHSMVDTSFIVFYVFGLLLGSTENASFFLRGKVCSSSFSHPSCPAVWELFSKCRVLKIWP